MPNTFEILTEFLRRHGEEVEGRDAGVLPPETSARLRRFAQGQLPAAEQAGLIRELSERSDWVAALAAEIKGLRGPAGGQPGK